MVSEARWAGAAKTLESRNKKVQKYGKYKDREQARICDYPIMPSDF